MDATVGLLLAEVLRTSVAAYFAYHKVQGKTDAEIDEMFKAELKKATEFDPKTIPDV